MPKKIHILGVCGTFMGGLSIIARQKGFEVEGSDLNAYPPMSDYLRDSGIKVNNGYSIEKLNPKPDEVLIGNTLKRGVEIVEHVLNEQYRYFSGAQWLYENVLYDKHVLAVSGTHGKTTTTSMLVKILDECGYNPGFMIGGVSKDFGESARLTDSKYFVIEADEYDTAFFDKRSKFIHYHPSTLIINNIEFDHADLFPSLDSIKTQFDHLLRVIPSKARVVYAGADKNVLDVIDKGCWSQKSSFGAKDQSFSPDWAYQMLEKDGSVFEVYFQNECVGKVQWDLIGDHNVSNALAAIAAAENIGIHPQDACKAISRFSGVKRRMDLVANNAQCYIYDDFAHHPTAIKKSVDALRNRVGDQKLFAIMEPRSNTMKMGTLKEEIVQAFGNADQIFIYQSPLVKWSVTEAFKGFYKPCHVYTDMDEMKLAIIQASKKNIDNKDATHLLIMSNGGFEGIHHTLKDALIR
ncbi:UDP-N-acetylmuramate:L-alanyl-gamma-D-glutamyl-meso-diaminopimelate ligase [Francisellaceae bacterium]|nr:UDP-N-acetylmuramate:L-alanyl-gamma-D-glutamyl-meso-diaminopimelate ligase [Francisellaceae bacterium]